MNKSNKIIIYSIILAIVLTSIFSIYQIYLKSSKVNSQDYNLPQSSIDSLKLVERNIRFNNFITFLPIYLIISFALSYLIIKLSLPKVNNTQ